MKEKGRSPYCPMCPTARARSQHSLCAELPSHFCNREKKKEKLQGSRISVWSKIREKRGERERERPRVPGGTVFTAFLSPYFIHFANPLKKSLTGRQNLEVAI